MHTVWTPLQDLMTHARITVNNQEHPWCLTNTEGALLTSSETWLNEFSILFKAGWVGDDILLHYSGIGQFLVTSDGREVQYLLDQTYARYPAEVVQWALLAVLSIALQVRGALCMHASCVSVFGGAVLFLGNSGVGKSTLATACVAAGAELIADDLAPVIFRKGRPFVLPTAGSLNLVSDMAGNWLEQDNLANTYAAAFDKHVVPVDRLGGTQAQVIAPLRGLLLVERTSSDSATGVHLQRIGGHRVGSALISHTYLAPLMPALGLEHTWMSQIGALAADVPIRVLQYKSGREYLVDAQRAVFEFVQERETA